MNVLKMIFNKLVKGSLLLIGAAILIAGSGTFDKSYAQRYLVKPEWLMPKHYPEGFHGWGRIGYIDSKEIVINDMNYRLSPFIEYNSPQRLNDSIYLFKVGKEVGFLLDDKGEIDTLWLIE
jgi:hypothetical protein